MILFVFEGERREVMLFRSIERLFFQRPFDNIVCSFKNNIYELYRQMQDLGDGADIVGILKDNGSIDLETDISDFSNVFLFFDLDIHNQNQGMDISRRQLREMLAFFDNETINGKLYVNYPMIESIYHTERLPDPNYLEYTIRIHECSDYKRVARDFGPYANLDHLCISERNLGRPEIVVRTKANWCHLIDMNVGKSLRLCDVATDCNNIKEAINQSNIFECQNSRHIEPYNEIAVLNSFPLFLFDYFKPESLMPN